MMDPATEGESIALAQLMARQMQIAACMVCQTMGYSRLPPREYCDALYNMARMLFASLPPEERLKAMTEFRDYLIPDVRETVAIHGENNIKTSGPITPPREMETADQDLVFAQVEGSKQVKQ